MTHMYLLFFAALQVLINLSRYPKVVSWNYVERAYLSDKVTLRCTSAYHLVNKSDSFGTRHLPFVPWPIKSSVVLIR